MNIRLIVGLGNPGFTYQDTRHNVGFWWLDILAQHWQTPLREEKKFHGEMARVQHNGRDVWLLKPLTFMNLSGQSVAALAQFYKIAPEEILVVHDELDIPCGRIRFKLGGGNGGHNGLKDIQAKLGSAQFYRLRLGIDHPGDKNMVAAYVLSKPSPDQRTQLDTVLAKCSEALPLLLNGKKDEAVRFLHSA